MSDDASESNAASNIYSVMTGKSNPEPSESGAASDRSGFKGPIIKNGKLGGMPVATEA